jgi:hypothetical protein
MPYLGNRCGRIRSPGKQIKIEFIPSKRWTVTIRRHRTKSEYESARSHNFGRAECGGGARGIA